MNREQLITLLALAGITLANEATDAEVADFYQKNKDMVGDATLDQVKPGIYGVPIDVNAGLSRSRIAWVKERGGVEEYQGRDIKPEDNGNVGAAHAATA